MYQWSQGEVFGDERHEMFWSMRLPTSGGEVDNMIMKSKNNGNCVIMSDSDRCTRRCT